MNFLELKERENIILKNEGQDGFDLRVHRAISWGVQAEKATGDDEKFIFYWISFNAIYGTNIKNLSDEKGAMINFFNKICLLDTKNIIRDKLWDIMPSVRILLENRFVYKNFWDYYCNNSMTEEEFIAKQKKICKITYNELVNKDNQSVLLEHLFDLIYLLRNQIFHGCATYNSSVNREQIKCSSMILKSIMPTIVDIVMTNRDVDWCEPSYPVVKC